MARSVGGWGLCAHFRSSHWRLLSADRTARAARRKRSGAQRRRDSIRWTKKTFRYRALGQLAAIGRRTGVAHICGLNFSGFVAWWLWRTIYLCKLPRAEKKVRVALDWTLDLCFAKDFACVTTPPRGRKRGFSGTRAG